MLGFMVKPLQAALRTLNQDALGPLEETERETLGAVRALDQATRSIERHVEVIETLATSVGPLTESVDRLNETMRDLVAVLAPVAGAEREVQRAEHFLRFRRHPQPAEPAAEPGDEHAPES